MGSGYAKMKKQARAMEEQFEKMREEMKAKQLSGASGNGLVTVVINGERELQEIRIKPECVDPNDIEGLQDLIKAALQDAYQKVGEEDTLGGIPLPFGKF